MMIKTAITADSLRRIRWLQRFFPKAMYSAFNAASKHARSRLAKSMREGGGNYGVPKMPTLHYISKKMRPGQKLGGILAKDKLIVRYRPNPDTQYIGWPDRLAMWAERFQEPNTHTFTTDERRHIHFKGIRDIPPTYERPDRDVINSFANQLASGDWPTMVLEAFDKYYKARMKKYGRVT